MPEQPTTSELRINYSELIENLKRARNYTAERINFLVKRGVGVFRDRLNEIVDLEFELYNNREFLERAGVPYTNPNLKTDMVLASIFDYLLSHNKNSDAS